MRMVLPLSAAGKIIAEPIMPEPTTVIVAIFITSYMYFVNASKLTIGQICIGRVKITLNAFLTEGQYWVPPSPHRLRSSNGSGGSPPVRQAQLWQADLTESQFSPPPVSTGIPPRNSNSAREMYHVRPPSQLP